MAVVVDASALLFVLTEPSPVAESARRRLADETVHAPHLLDAEVGSVLRRKVLQGEMSVDHATVILSSYPVLLDHRYEHHGLLAAMAWELRENLTFYDALYVALGAALDVDVVTLDARMASMPDPPTRITLPTE